MKNHPNKSSGFTIVELLMATAVFSLVLLVAIIGFIQVGKMFYKGIEVSKTQDAAGNIVDSLTNDLHTLVSGDTLAIRTLNGNNSMGYVCVGIHRYTFFLSQGNTSTNIVDTSTPVGAGTQAGLVRDDMSSKTDCRSPGTTLGSLTFTPSAQQMLGDGMSLGKFYLKQPDALNMPSLWSIKVQVAFGDNSNPGGVFDQSGSDSDNGIGVAANTLRCAGVLGSNLCAVSSLNTFANVGFAIQ